MSYGWERARRDSSETPRRRRAGWLALTRAERGGRPERWAMREEAFEIAGDRGRDLEAAALARRGYAELATGAVEVGRPTGSTRRSRGDRG